MFFLVFLPWSIEAQPSLTTDFNKKKYKMQSSISFVCTQLTLLVDTEAMFLERGGKNS